VTKMWGRNTEPVLERLASSRQSSLESGTKRHRHDALGWRLLRNPVWQTLRANRAAPASSLLASVSPGLGLRERPPGEDSQLTQMTQVVLTIFNCEGYRGGVRSSVVRARKLLKEARSRSS
jgi:hypothetical protein